MPARTAPSFAGRPTPSTRTPRKHSCAVGTIYVTRPRGAYRRSAGLEDERKYRLAGAGGRVMGSQGDNIDQTGIGKLGVDDD